MKLELFKDRSKKWRWRVRARNGKIVCTAGENFASRRNAAKSFERFAGDDWFWAGLGFHR